MGPICCATLQSVCQRQLIHRDCRDASHAGTAPLSPDRRSKSARKRSEAVEQLVLHGLTEFGESWARLGAPYSGLVSALVGLFAKETKRLQDGAVTE